MRNVENSCSSSQAPGNNIFSLKYIDFVQITGHEGMNRSLGIKRIEAESLSCVISDMTTEITNEYK
jgi:hypothetical protein